MVPQKISIFSLFCVSILSACTEPRRTDEVATQLCESLQEEDVSASGEAGKWRTVDRFEYAQNRLNLAYDLTLDAEGNLYVVGEGGNSSVLAGKEEMGHALVRKSADRGETWSTVHDLNSALVLRLRPSHGDFSGITADGSGRIFVSGGFESASSRSWLISMSSDGGKSWVNQEAPIYFRVKSILNLPGSALVAGGNAIELPWSWRVKLSADSGATWKDSDSFVLAEKQLSALVDISKDALGNIYAFGYAMDAEGKLHWIVRKSSDQGASWMTIDDFQLEGKRSAPSGMGVDSSGALYVYGFALSESASGQNEFTWITRKSADGGATWSTVDSALASAAYARNDANIKSVSLRPAAFAQGPGGKLYIAGTVELMTQDSMNDIKWLIRSSSDGGASWSTESEYAHVSRCRIMNDEVGYMIPDTGPKRMVVDAQGDVFVVGSVRTGIHVNPPDLPGARDMNNFLATRWIVRKKSP